MKRAAFSLSVAVTLGSGLWFADLRKGKLGYNKITIEDEKYFEYTKRLDRGLFQDQLTVFKKDRTDFLVSASKEYHLSKTIRSFKPIQVEHVGYPREKELFNAMIVQYDQSCQEKADKQTLRADLKKVIDNF